MKTIISILLAMVGFMPAFAYKYSYSFNNTPISEALVKISKDNPELNISFIYKDLDNYRSSAKVKTDDILEALRQTIGLNPISVISLQNNYYIEALQHGRYKYTGRTIGSDDQPVAAATVMLLMPNDSTVLTYGMTDAEGRFSIPCDRKGVIAKISCLGYKTVVTDFNRFSVGTITMEENAVALGEVNVEAASAVFTPNVSIYIPSARQKKFSQTAIMLLSQMAIPEIKVDPVSGTVTDVGGQGVSLYVNNMKASSEELVGMKISDVKKVEYMEYPTDPRFRGEPRVINFIVQEYEYGGYTKLTTKEDFFAGFMSANSVYSKFSYKKMTFDIYAAINHDNSHHEGSDEDAKYKLKDADGRDYSLIRQEKVEKSHNVTNGYPVTFRATYNSEKVQIRNVAGFSHNTTPVDSQSGQLLYSNNTNSVYRYAINNPYRYKTLSYDGSFFFILPRGFSADLSATFKYTHSNDRRTYISTNSPEIVRDAREDALEYRIDATLEKQFSQNHNLSLAINGGGWHNKLKYSGSASYSDWFENPFAAGIIGYTFSGKKIRLYSDVGVAYEGSNINGQQIKDIYPFVHINIRYSLNKKNVLSTYIQYATNSAGIELKSDDILQDNEYLFITGNPKLKACRHTTLNLSYSYAPSNNFSVTAYNNWYGLYDRYIKTYEPYEDGKALIRTYVNNGHFFREQLGANANLKLFNRNLQISASPLYNYFRSTGIYDKSCGWLEVRAQAYWYFKNVYFNLYYISKIKNMSSLYPEITTMRNFHRISVGWASGNWNVALDINNIFNKGWKLYTVDMESPYLSSRSTRYYFSRHFYVGLSATYTFGYGKKVQRGNEVGEQGGAASAIMK